MKTTIPNGTWVKTKYHGEWEFGVIVDDGIELNGPPPAGTMVQRCVWKSDELLEPRGNPQPYKGE